MTTCFQIYKKVSPYTINALHSFLFTKWGKIYPTGKFDYCQHRTKYQESGNLNIAETQRLTRVSVSGYITVSHVSVAAFSTEPEHFFSRFRQISVSGITYFRYRYHVNKLRKREITFGNKFVSFLLSAETWSYGPATCLFFFFLFPSVSVALTT